MASLQSLFLQNFSIIINYTMWSSNLFFFASSCFPCFSQARFSGSKFFWVQVQGPDPGSGSRFQKQPMQSNFIEIPLLHGCSPAHLLHTLRMVSHKITSRRLFLNKAMDNREKGDRKIQCNRNQVYSLFDIFICFSLLFLLKNTKV